MNETLRCPLQFVVDHRLALPLRCAAPPDAETLERHVRDWIGTHIDTPLREALQAYAERGFGQFHVVPSSHPSMAGLLQNTRSYEHQEDEDPLQRDGVHFCIVICSQGFLVPSTPHVWFGRVAAHALAEHFATSVIDVAHALCDKRYKDAHFIAPKQGFLHMARHLRFLGSTPAPGLVRLSSLGMHVFGLPELELAACPQELLQTGQLLLLGAAQHLVHAGMQFIHDADKKTLVKEDLEAFATPARLEINGALLFEATEGGANEDGGSTWVRLTLPDAYQGRIVRLEPPLQAAEQSDASWMQKAHDDLIAVLEAPAGPNTADPSHAASAHQQAAPQSAAAPT